MKQIFAALTALTLLCTLTACGGVADQSASAPSPSDQKELLSENGTPSTPGEREPAAAEDPRVLVAYFSATGNTEHIAQYIQTILNADLYEIVPEEPTQMTISITTTTTAGPTGNKTTPMPGPP